MDEIDTPLDGQMNGHIGQIDDEPPLDGQMNDYIGHLDCQIDDEFMPPLDRQMNYYIGQMDGETIPHASSRRRRTAII